MQKYKWLLIDMDDTLFDYKKSEAVALEKTCLEFFGAFNKEMHIRYDELNREGWKLFQDAKISIEEVKLNRFTKMIEYFDVTKSISAETVSVEYLYNLSRQSFLLDGAEDFIKLLSGKGFNLSIITNGVKRNQLSRIELAGVGKYFDQIIISEDAGLAKPHKQFFDFAKERIGFDCSEALVIGDSLESDIKGGNNYGIDTCWFNLDNNENNTSIDPTYETRDYTQIQQLLLRDN